jgi:hypothetical protein
VQNDHFFPVGVLQAPVEKTKNVALKKLVCIIWNIHIDTLPTQKLAFFHLEHACPRTEQQKLVFWQMKKFYSFQLFVNFLYLY